MKKDLLLKQLAIVEKVANASKLSRFAHNPYKYLEAILYRKFFYVKNKKEIARNAKLFYGESMNVLLPASTDIYITGGKSHDSEIRLAKYLIIQLDKGDILLDVGAHYGYFSLLGSKLVQAEGKVYSVEAAPKTFAILQENAKTHSNITIFNNALSNVHSSLTFYEFSNMYCEYNSLDIKQFECEDWFKENKPKAIDIEALTLDELTVKNNFVPNLIKIDVEGAENLVIAGGANLFTAHKPIVIMEYLEPKRNNKAHKEAKETLESFGYTSHIIMPTGELYAVQDIDSFLEEKSLDSDNIVFIKK